MNAEGVYVSAGCARASKSAACLSHSGLVAFAAGPRLAFWDSSKEYGIQEALDGHGADITKVRFLRDDAIVSGDKEGGVRLWNKTAASWTSWSLPGPSTVASISALGTVDLPSLAVSIVASGSSDGRLRIWSIADKHADLVQEIDCGGRMPLDCALTLLPGSSDLILALASTDTRLRIYTSSIFAIDFRCAVVLAGHTDWTRSLDFAIDPEHPSQVLLASGSQDHGVRLWRIASCGTGQSVADDELEIEVRSHAFSVDSQAYSLRSEAMLVAHESWITDLSWRPLPDGSLELLTASADRSMIIWRYDTMAKVWLAARHFGELKPSEHSLAFFGALHTCTLADEEAVIAHGWSGAFHVWRKGKGTDWKPAVAPTGHLGDVRALAWDPQGQYLLTAGADRTTRMHACCRGIWREASRPQVHGHELFALSFIGQDRLQIASVADETVLRLYEAPLRCIERLKSLEAATGFDAVKVDGRPRTAAIPTLGLTSRPVDEEAPVDDPTLWTEAPLDEELATLTLWPELDKHYGHGYELRAVASSPDGHFLVSSCKAASPEHAVLRVRDMRTGKEQPVSPSDSHSLTVARIAFSPDGRRLLTVSRDRSWRVYAVAGDGIDFSLQGAGDKAHGRMINDACWLDDMGTAFATASRDKTVKLWRLEVDAYTAYASIKMSESVTSVAALPSRACLALGVESGAVSLYALDGHLWGNLDARLAHTGAVHQLAFCPRLKDDDRVRLASCGADGLVRIVDLVL